MNGGSPNYTAFSFPKLNGSPSRPTINHTGSGSGFMGFGPTGFTTPMDTVLDRFGRTGAIFPSAPMNGSGYANCSSPVNHFSAQNFGGGFVITQPSVPPHRTLPTVIHPPFGRSNSLGRSLPPLPCNNPPSPAPPLVRRRTFDDEDDQRTDWI